MEWICRAMLSGAWPVVHQTFSVTVALGGLLRGREGGPLNWPPSAHTVAGNGRPLSWAPSADAVAGNGGALSCALSADAVAGGMGSRR